MSEAKVTEINIPYPEEGEAHLRLNVGACRLKVRPGGGEALVSGTYEDPTGTLPLNIIQDGSTVRITQGRSVVDWFGVFSGVPRFDLALGTARPYILTFEGGASENVLDLGGLPLSRLVIKHGAGKLDIDFSAPNPHEMSLLELGSGAGGMEIRNLANANFAEMRVDGGAASYQVRLRRRSAAQRARAHLHRRLVRGDQRARRHRRQDLPGIPDGRPGRGRWLHEEGRGLLDGGRPGRGDARAGHPH